MFETQARIGHLHPFPQPIQQQLAFRTSHPAKKKPLLCSHMASARIAPLAGAWMKGLVEAWVTRPLRNLYTITGEWMPEVPRYRYPYESFYVPLRLVVGHHDRTCSQATLGVKEEEEEEEEESERRAETTTGPRPTVVGVFGLMPLQERKTRLRRLLLQHGISLSRMREENGPSPEDKGGFEVLDIKDGPIFVMPDTCLPDCGYLARGVWNLTTGIFLLKLSHRNSFPDSSNVDREAWRTLLSEQCCAIADSVVFIMSSDLISEHEIAFLGSIASRCAQHKCRLFVSLSQDEGREKVSADPRLTKTHAHTHLSSSCI